MCSEFILTVAGEDSGDVLGERVVEEILKSGFQARGAGGFRMQSAGLKPVANFESMAVNGFFDVLKKLPKLFFIRNRLKKILRGKNCKALICIDYPGMNLSLMRLAKKMNKPVFYIAPPKIWAWKRYRGKYFRDVDVGVFFDFEKEIYEKFGARATIIEHPCFSKRNLCEEFKGKVLFLPGSRMGQVKRNLPKYMEMASEHENALFVAPRKEILDFLSKKLGNKFPVVLKPANASFAGASAAVCMPGTAALETFTAEVPTKAVAVVDLLTLLIGKLFLKTKYLTLPNIILQREVIHEHLFVNFLSLQLCLTSPKQQSSKLSNLPTKKQSQGSQGQIPP
jgi:lipid-A-disaccharide synthase